MEGTLVKVIRLLANLITEESVGSLLHQVKGNLMSILKDLCTSMKKKSIEQSEEFMLNSVSLLTNLLFYDTPKTPLIEEPALKRNVS